MHATACYNPSHLSSEILTVFGAILSEPQINSYVRIVYMCVYIRIIESVNSISRDDTDTPYM